MEVKNYNGLVHVFLGAEPQLKRGLFPAPKRVAKIHGQPGAVLDCKTNQNKPEYFFISIASSLTELKVLPVTGKLSFESGPVPM